MRRLDGLNAAQTAAVKHLEGPACVIAGAGAGKTRVITVRAAHLVEEHGVPAAAVLLCTFTKKAAGEMGERLQELIGPSATEQMSIGTIHSLCYRILREEWRHEGLSFEPLSDYWQKRYFKDILGAAPPWGMNWECDLGEAMAKVSRLKNELYTPDRYAAELADDEPEGDRWLELYRRYEKRKTGECKIDFDDMLLLCHELLRDNPGVLGRWRRFFSYIEVDEFQDTNTAQWEIIRLLAAPKNNLFVVGDDWQSVYGWRSAKPELIVNFREHYPEAATYVLETNYRSLPHVVEAGNRLIGHNAGQFPKVLRAHRDGQGELYRIQAADDEAEAKMVIGEIQALLEEGHHPRDFACLYRVNAYSRAFEEALVAAEIPYVIVGSAGFFRRREVQDMVAYLRLAADPRDADAFRRAVMAPSRFLGASYVKAVEDHARGRSLLDSATRAPGLKPYQIRNAQQFVDVVRHIGGLKPAEAITAIRDLTEYDDWLKRDDTEGEADNDRLENLRSLEAAAGRFPTIDAFLKYVETMMARSRDAEQAGDKVVLSTIHRAKGLEWPVVFVVGVAEKLLPHRLAEDVAEERRLCYVALTRARDRLYVCSPAAYAGKGLEMSQFIPEIHEAWQPADGVPPGVDVEALKHEIRREHNDMVRAAMADEPGGGPR